MSRKQETVLGARQKKILSALLDKYEGSRTYRGTNQVSQRFSVDPEKVFPEYRRDTAAVEKIEAFEAELGQLRDAGLVKLEKKDGEVARILMDLDGLEAYYRLLDRLPRATREQKEIEWYRSRKGTHAVLDRWCDGQLTRLSQGKRAIYTLEETKILFDALGRILSNQEEILERELSIDLFGDSKVFERGIRRKVCRVMRESRLYEEILEGIDDHRLCEQVLLGEHQVVPNPTYLYLKGDGEIQFGEKAREGRMILDPKDPVAISSRSLPRILGIYVHDPEVLTVENLTAFQRTAAKGRFLLYLGGYHSTDKALFLKRIAKENPGLIFRHFGDLDPDGFLIIEHLRRRTGLDVRPWKMGRAELERYAAFGRPLTEQDRVKAENLLHKGRYSRELQYMIERGCKLEQEIIAWKEG